MIANVPEFLLVEDNRFDVEISLFDLEEHGIANKFVIARDGAEAIDYLFGEDGSLRVEPPKIIFLDLHMPKICGLDFLKRIKAHEQTRRIPVIVLKSSISPVEFIECQRLGVHDYIDKPLEYDNFANIVRNILPHFPM